MPRKPLAPPADLSEAAKARWLLVAPALARRGEVDVDLLTSYCNAYARWRQAEAGLAKTGPLVKNEKGRPMANPLVNVSRQAAAEVRALEKQIGLAEATAEAEAGGGDLLSRRELAIRLSVHMQTVTKWEREGLPIAHRGGRGRSSMYDEAVVRAWLKARESGAAAGNTPFQKLQEAHTRQRHALAELAELQLEEKRGRLVDAESVRARITDVFARCRTRLLGLPSKAKLALPHLTHADVLAVDKLVRESLEELSTMPVDGGAPA